MIVLTKKAAQIYAPVDENGTPRGPELNEAAVWGTEIEVGFGLALDASEQASGNAAEAKALSEAAAANAQSAVQNAAAANIAAANAQTSAQVAAAQAVNAASGRVVVMTKAQLDLVVPAAGAFPGGEVRSDPAGEAVNGAYVWTGSVWNRVGPLIEEQKIATSAQRMTLWESVRRPLLDNLFDYKRITVGKFVNGATGELFSVGGTDDPNGCVSGFIPVYPGSSVGSNFDINQYAFYGLDFAYISGSNIPKPPNTGGVAVPGNAYYMRFSMATVLAPQYMIVNGAIAPNYYLPFNGNGGADGRPWQDKVYSAFGDSITRLNGYQPMVATLTGANWVEFTDDGVDGRTMHDAVSVLTPSYVGNIAANVMTVWLGTNDFGYSQRPLGAMTDALGANTFFADVKGVVNNILNVRPSLALGFVTPMKRDNVPSSSQPRWNEVNSQGYSMTQMVDAILAVCDFYSVPVLDMFRNSGVSDLTFGHYLGDGLHPTGEGNLLIGRKVGEFVNSRL